MKGRVIGLAVCVLAIFAVGQAQALTIFDGGAPNQANGSEMTWFVQAEDFTLTAPNVKVTDAHFWTLEDPQAWDGTLTYYFFTDDGGQPTAGAPFATGQGQNIVRTEIQDVTALAMTEYSYSFDLEAPETLLADTTYWFGLHLAADFPSTSFPAIYWETTSTGTGYGVMGQAEPGGPDNPETELGWVWQSSDLHHAFYLTGGPIDDGPIPEPSTFIVWSLLASLGIAAGWWRRKRAA